MLVHGPKYMEQIIKFVQHGVKVRPEPWDPETRTPGRIKVSLRDPTNKSIKLNVIY